MHWADVEASALRSISDEHIISTGITPSGHIHVGNMREILTGNGIYRAAKDAGIDARHIHVADTFDPLRKVYSFLDESYARHVGRPLSEIPCPCGGHKNYAEHFLTPFLASLDELGVECEIVKTHELYRKGSFSDAIDTLFQNIDAIKQILQDLSGRELGQDWFPYSPKCKGCGSFSDATVLGYKKPFVYYKCKCGEEGKASIEKDDGKLPWRLDWPTRWYVLGVTCEPFGKDHATKGGSYETGKKIIEDILGGRAPHPIIYEWIQLKGMGAMSSSKGVVVKTEDMLKMTPPQVLRFLILKNQPNKHIDLETGLGFLNIVDDYDMHERCYFGVESDHEKLDDMKRTYVLSQPKGVPEDMPPQIPYRHFVNLVQISGDWENIKEILYRAGLLSEKLNDSEEEKLIQRAENARYWLDVFAPDNVKFSVQRNAPDVELNPEQRKVVRGLAAALEGTRWTGDSIHDAIYSVVQASALKPKDVFKTVYMLILGQPRGPRLGYFLSYLDRDFVVARFKEATEAAK